MVDPTLPLLGLSPVAGKQIVARFDGGRLSSDGGLLVLREIERRLEVADRLAACIDDPRDSESTVHTLADIIRFRLLMIAAGYEDGNDATFDAVHGGQQLRLFNAHYDDYGFQPIVVFDAEGRFVTALLRPAKRPKGVEIRAFLRRLIRAIRAHWPQVEILLRADSHYACPDVMDWCETNSLDYVFGLAPSGGISPASRKAPRRASRPR